MINIYSGYIFSAIIVATLISKLGSVHRHYTMRKQEWLKAKVYFDSDNCQNHILRSSLGDFNLCNRAESILSVHPILQALYDTSDDLSPCGKDGERCQSVFREIKQNIVYIIALLLTLVFLMIRCSNGNRRYTNELRQWERYHLPVSNG